MVRERAQPSDQEGITTVVWYSLFFFCIDLIFNGKGVLREFLASCAPVSSPRLGPCKIFSFPCVRVLCNLPCCLYIFRTLPLS